MIWFWLVYVIWCALMLGIVVGADGKGSRGLTWLICLGGGTTFLVLDTLAH